MNRLWRRSRKDIISCWKTDGGNRRKDEGKIGEIQSIHHIENIGYWHFAHSYVRGNWRNKESATPMIVAKCSHDTDTMNYPYKGI